MAGCPLVVLCRKLQMLKKELKSWNHSCFGNVTQNVLLAESELIQIKESSLVDNGDFNRLEKEAQDKLSLALDVEESFWREKARIKWHIKGDRNTAYFHRISKIRNAIKPISILKYGEEMISEPDPAVLQFFSSSWLPTGFNSNVLVLIPKTDNAESLDLFRPIALSNFKYKIITKIIATRLALVMPHIVSNEQRGFIQGRKIKDCIALASEAYNLMDSKSWCGNMALKVDITKAFDTINWQFLLNV
ncbi:uncharacterized protein LOC131619129 [Vicia villosa]|uniref:uncharacterized protein LOC131619129 n=1 Tax=Vicia villosa TaxID=3911 RepID=UPI00273BF0BA|nr:uncharacterized protein LOC131619129 [Vicia villosa]